MSVLKRLTGRIAIVTASTEGIGFAIAQRLAREGAKVIVSSRKEKNVNKAIETLKTEGLDVKGITCHVSKPEDRKKLFDEAIKCGGLDILVSNAAVNPEVGEVLNCSESSWDKIFDVNVKSSYLLAKEALPLLRKSKAGRIIFISSITGFRPDNVLGAYSVSKTALFGLTKAAALQLGPENITINCIAPGLIETKFSNAITSQQTAKDHWLSMTSLNRLGVPHDISGSAAFLASDDGAYLTGEILVVAGGIVNRL